MSNYTPTTDFSAKDALQTGDSDKQLRGQEFDTEFDAIALDIATKVEASSGVHTGTTSMASATMSGTLAVTGVATLASATVTGNIDGAAITGDSVSVTGDVATATVTATGVIDAASYTGDGSALTNMPSSAHVIETGGTPKTQRAALNFKYTSFALTDNSGADSTDVDLSAGVLATLADAVIADDDAGAGTDQPLKMQRLTFAQYGALTPVATTLYLIIG